MACLHTYHLLTSSEQHKREKKLFFYECSVKFVYVDTVKGRFNFHSVKFSIQLYRNRFHQLEIKRSPRRQINMINNIAKCDCCFPVGFITVSPLIFDVVSSLNWLTVFVECLIIKLIIVVVSDMSSIVLIALSLSVFVPNVYISMYCGRKKRETVNIVFTQKQTQILSHKNLRDSSPKLIFIFKKICTL